MDNNKFYLLDYSHDELEMLLDKIATGNVLNNEDYKLLVEIIGIKNISTFSGDYEDLQNKPEIPSYMSDLINDLDFDTITNVNNKLQAVKNSLIELLDSNSTQSNLQFSTKVETENNLTSAKLYADEEIAKAIRNLNITGLASKSEVGLKADKVHLHNISDVSGLIPELEKKSDIDHNHDLRYASSLNEHRHTDLDALNTITQNKIDIWEDHMINTEVTLQLKADIDHDHDGDYGRKEFEHVHNNKDALDRIFPEDINRWDTCLDFDTRNKLVSANVGGVSEGANLSGLTIHDILRRILYPDKKYEIAASIKLNLSGNVFEKGTSVTVNQLVLTVKDKGSNPIKEILFIVDGVIVQTLENPNSDASSFAYNVNTVLKDSIGADYFRVQLKDTTEVIVKANSSAVNFYYPYYYGVVKENQTITEALVKGKTKKIAGKANQTCTFTMNDECAMFAYPASYGTLSSVADPSNFELINSFTRHTVNITGLDGEVQQYYVYVGSANTNTNFNMTFKF